MKDQLVKALVCQGRVRVYLVHTTQMVQEAHERFDTHPTASAALGRTLTVGSMMGAMLKSEKEMLTITINGHGPIGTIMVDAYPDGSVRGFVSDPHVEDAFKDNGKLGCRCRSWNQWNINGHKRFTYGKKTGQEPWSYNPVKLAMILPITSH